MDQTTSGQADDQRGVSHVGLAVCRNCKHWRLEHHNYFVGSGLGGCMSPDILQGYSCLGSAAEVKSNQALVEDDEGWGMVTGPEFGCIHFFANIAGQPTASTGLSIHR